MERSLTGAARAIPPRARRISPAIRRHATGWVHLGRLSVARWIDDGASSMGAALAFYSLLSMAPVLLMVITVAGLFFGEDAARGALIGELSALFGTTGAQAVEAVLVASSNHDGGLVSLTIGIALLLVGATTVVAELHGDLDRIWRFTPDPKRLVGYFLRARMLSFGLILGVGFLLAVALVLTAAISAIGGVWNRWFTGAEVLLQILNAVLGFAVITTLFALIYRVLPSVRIPWRDVWVGAAFTSVLFSAGKYLIGLYLGTAAISSSFGAAGALVVIVVWVYYSAQIFLLGAEFTHEYSRLRGSGAAPLAVASPESTTAGAGAAVSQTGASGVIAGSEPQLAQKKPVDALCGSTGES
ncbi:MAG: YihY/virulence factor BrkB family protein [Panacagrimonas sp.]